MSFKDKECVELPDGGLGSFFRYLVKQEKRIKDLETNLLKQMEKHDVDMEKVQAKCLNRIKNLENKHNEDIKNLKSEIEDCCNRKPVPTEG